MWKKKIGQDELLQKAAELKKNGFKPGCDGMSAKSAELWMAINGERLLGSFFRGDYDPMPAEGFRVAKKNGTFRILTRMTAIDSILQRCLLDAVRADCEEVFSDSSFAYREGRGVNAALQKYCEYGSIYRLAAKIDPYQCFDTMDYEVLLEALRVFFDDEVLVKNLMKFAQMPVLEGGEPTERECGIPQGSPLGPLFCNIYMHSLDMLLQERGFPFIRYADDIVLFANDTASLSAGVKLVESHLTQKLKLKPNARKSQQGAPFGIKYLGHSFYVGKDGILTVGEGESVSAAYHAWHSRKVRNSGKVVHILSDGILRRKDQSLLLDTETGHYDIPGRNTDIINIFSDVILDSGFLLTASRNGITVNVFDSKGHLLGSYFPNRPLRSPKVTIEQLNAYRDEKHRCELAKAFILGSIHNCRLNIRYYNKNRPDPAYDSVLDDVKMLEQRIKECKRYGNLLMLEARVRSLYYSCFDSFIVEEGFPYERRTRQPPQNELNAMISFGNTILYSYIATEINKTALDVRVGFLHATNSRMESLNLDIAELFKPLIVDRAVFTLINRRQMRPDAHFAKSEGDGVYLNAEGKRLFLEALDDKLHVHITEHGRSLTYTELITEEVRKLIRHFKTGEKYSPFKQVR